MSCQNGVSIHFLQRYAASGELFSRDHFQFLSLGHCVGTMMGLEIADDNVLTLTLQRLRLFQHLVGFADTGSVAHKNFKSSALLFSHFLLGKILTSMPRDFSISLSTLLPRTLDHSFERWLCPMKSWVTPRALANSKMEFTGSSPSRISMWIPILRAISSFWSSAVRSVRDSSGSLAWATINSPWKRRAIVRPVSSISCASAREVRQTRILSWAPKLCLMPWEPR